MACFVWFCFWASVMTDFRQVHFSLAGHCTVNVGNLAVNCEWWCVAPVSVV